MQVRTWQSSKSWLILSLFVAMLITTGCKLPGVPQMSLPTIPMPSMAWLKSDKSDDSYIASRDRNNYPQPPASQFRPGKSPAANGTQGSGQGYPYVASRNTHGSSNPYGRGSSTNQNMNPSNSGLNSGSGFNSTAPASYNPGSASSTNPYGNRFGGGSSTPGTRPSRAPYEVPSTQGSPSNYNGGRSPSQGFGAATPGSNSQFQPGGGTFAPSQRNAATQWPPSSTTQPPANGNRLSQNGSGSPQPPSMTNSGTRTASLPNSYPNTGYGNGPSPRPSTSFAQNRNPTMTASAQPPSGQSFGNTRTAPGSPTATQSPGNSTVPKLPASLANQSGGYAPGSTSGQPVQPASFQQGSSSGFPSGSSGTSPLGSTPKPNNTPANGGGSFPGTSPSMGSGYR